MSAEPVDPSCLFQSTNERPEPISAEVRGTIPTWLTGALVRVGPGRFECGDTPLNHWFDGQGLLHCFHIEAGQVTYSNKFVRSDSWADSLEHGISCHLSRVWNVCPSRPVPKHLYSLLLAVLGRRSCL